MPCHRTRASAFTFFPVFPWRVTYGSRIIKTLRENLVFAERAFYRLNEQIVPDRTDDIIISVLAVTLQKTVNSKHFTMDSSLHMKKTLFLSEKSNKRDQRITGTFTEKILSIKREHLLKAQV